MRPLTAATLFVAAGVLAALPFRRPLADSSTERSPGIATGPRSAAIDAMSASQRGNWSTGSNFDPSLAWQPVPMTLPERASPELPPMPDSYYDLAFELEQPDPIRQRFSAAVKNRSEPLAASAPLAGAQPHKPGALMPLAASDQSESVAAARLTQPVRSRHQAQPDRNEPVLAAEDLIKDRFVYTPIEPPQRASTPAADPRAQRGTQAQNASMIRSGVTPLDEGSRKRQFIREPQ